MTKQKPAVASMAVVPEMALTMVRVLTEQGYRCTNLTAGSFTIENEDEEKSFDCLWFDIEGV